jgi:hypothetical protein
VTPKATGLLALVALVLGAFVFFYEIEGDPTRRAAIDDAKNIHTGLAAAEIGAVMLTTLDGIPARFERRDGRWEVVSPLQARADATALDAIVHALANMPREGRIDGDRPLSGFGLETGVQTIRFEVGGETRGLRIGRSTPVGGHRYVARLGDDEVAFVASYRVNAFNRNLADLRDRRIFQFEAGDLRTLRVTWPTGRAGEELEVALARDDAGAWHLGFPLVGPGDQEVVRDLLANLAYLRADGFVDESDAPAGSELRDALDETSLRINWTVEGAHLEREARIAGELDGQRVIEAPGGRLYKIAAERLDDFPRAVVDYRSKRMATFEHSAARRLKLEFLRVDEDEAAGQGATESTRVGDGARGLRVVAELGEAGWSSPDPSIDPDRASQLIRELASLRAIDIVADEMGPAELASLGLNPPRARIRVEGGADPKQPAETLADLLIGRLDTDRGVFAQRADVPTIFLLPAAVVADLPISAERYRSDFAMAPVSEGEGEGLGVDEGEGESPGVDEGLESDPAPAADPLEGVGLP